MAELCFVYNFKTVGICFHCLYYSIDEFATYLNYCRSLRFEDKPDYSYLRELFRGLFHKLGYTYDYIFDWSAKNPTPSHSSGQMSSTSMGAHGSVPSKMGHLQHPSVPSTPGGVISHGSRGAVGGTTPVGLSSQPSSGIPGKELANHPRILCLLSVNDIFAHTYNILNLSLINNIMYFIS